MRPTKKKITKRTDRVQQRGFQREIEKLRAADTFLRVRRSSSNTLLCMRTLRRHFLTWLLFCKIGTAIWACSFPFVFLENIFLTLACKLVGSIFFIFALVSTQSARIHQNRPTFARCVSTIRLVAAHLANRPLRVSLDQISLKNVVFRLRACVFVLQAAARFSAHRGRSQYCRQVAISARRLLAFFFSQKHWRFVAGL